MAAGVYSRAQKRAHAPSCIQPAVADRAGMEHVVAQRSRTTTSRHHRAQEQGPTVPRKITLRLPRRKTRPSRISRTKRSDCSFRGLDVMLQFLRARHNVTPLSHREVAEE